MRFSSLTFLGQKKTEKSWFKCKNGSCSFCARRFQEKREKDQVGKVFWKSLFQSSIWLLELNWKKK